MINFIIGALFLTNLWVIIYTKTVDYLYFLTPAKIEEVLYGKILGNPEPFEIFFYIVLSVLFVIFIWFFYAFLKGKLNLDYLDKEKSLIFILLKSAIFIFLFLIFVSKLGDFPNADDPLLYKFQVQNFVKNIVIFCYLTLVLFTTLQSCILQKIIGKNKFVSSIIHILFIVFIAFLIFTPGFPISPPDGSLFYGPAYEVASGKTIFTDFPSQYGFLSAILFGLFYKISQVNFIYLPIFIWLLYTATYFISFYLIHKISRSLPFATLGVFSLITINYFARIYNPQASPLRWFPIFLSLFLVYVFKKIDSEPLLILLPFLAFWNIDSGIALGFGYIFTLFLLFLSKKINLKRLIYILGILALSTILIVIFMQAFHLILGYRMVDFFRLYHSLRKNAVVGLIMVPIPTNTYFWLFMLVYFSSIIYFIRNTKQTVEYRGWKIDKEARGSRIEKFYLLSSIFKFQPSTFYSLPSSNLQLLLFSANLMFFSSIYYVGRSMPHELYTISSFAILTFLILVGLTFKYQLLLIRLIISAFIFIFLICLPALQRKDYIVGKIIDNYIRFSQGQLFTSDIDTIVAKNYNQEAAFIKDNLKEKEIIVISADSTYLFYLTKKKTLLNVNPIFTGIDMASEMPFAIKKATQVCPEKIAVDCSLVKKCPEYKTLTARMPSLYILQREIEDKCKIKYESTICSSKLCIAKTKKQ